MMAVEIRRAIPEQVVAESVGRWRHDLQPRQTKRDRGRLATFSGSAGGWAKAGDQAPALLSNAQGPSISAGSPVP